MAATIIRTAGIGLAGLGLAHFVRPEAFEGVTKTVFPTDTRQWVYVNGVLETAIGLAFAGGGKRLGTLGALGYGAWLGANALRNR